MKKNVKRWIICSPALEAMPKPCIPVSGKDCLFVEPGWHGDVVNMVEGDALNNNNNNNNNNNRMQAAQRQQNRPSGGSPVGRADELLPQLRDLLCVRIEACRRRTDCRGAGPAAQAKELATSARKQARSGLWTNCWLTLLFRFPTRNCLPMIAQNFVKGFCTS